MDSIGRYFMNLDGTPSLKPRCEAQTIGPPMDSGTASGVINRLFHFFYQRKKPRPAPEARPRLARLPKYTFTFAPPSSLASAADPVALLEPILTNLGFELDRETRHKAVFRRGYDVGDFSIKYIAVNITFALPMTDAVQMTLAYGKFAAVDTGALWQLGREVEAAVLACAEADPPQLEAPAESPIEVATPVPETVPRKHD